MLLIAASVRCDDQLYVQYRNDSAIGAGEVSSIAAGMGADPRVTLRDGHWRFLRLRKPLYRYACQHDGALRGWL